MKGISIFLYIIVGFQFILTFFQLILSIEANLKENQVQIGILRAIGLTKNDVL